MISGKCFNVALVVMLITVFFSCRQREEPQTFVPPGQDSTVNKEKERLAKEEFEMLKNQQGDSAHLNDSLHSATDTTKVDSLKSSAKTSEKKQFVKKEKELNKRLDNPKTAISDYIEFLQRGTTEGGNFEQNMKKASDQWQTSNLNRFKTNYKNTKKIVVLEEPKVISQKDGAATVQVRLKKSDLVNGKTVDMDMVVKYNLIVDSKGKWKIQNNVVVKK